MFNACSISMQIVVWRYLARWSWRVCEPPVGCLSLRWGGRLAHNKFDTGADKTTLARSPARHEESDWARIIKERDTSGSRKDDGVGGGSMSPIGSEDNGKRWRSNPIRQRCLQRRHKTRTHNKHKKKKQDEHETKKRQTQTQDKHETNKRQTNTKARQTLNKQKANREQMSPDATFRGLSSCLGWRERAQNSDDKKQRKNNGNKIRVSDIRCRSMKRQVKETDWPFQNNILGQNGSLQWVVKINKRLTCFELERIDPGFICQSLVKTQWEKKESFCVFDDGVFYAWLALTSLR